MSPKLEGRLIFLASFNALNLNRNSHGKLETIQQTDRPSKGTRVRTAGSGCQIASNRDPLFASKNDPPDGLRLGALCALEAVAGGG